MEHVERFPVLVVDDDRSVLALLRSWLSTGPWEPECHHDPREALASFEVRRHRAVVVDRQLPGLRDLELVRRFRASNGEHPAYLILITSSESADLIPEAYLEGVDDFVRKPLAKREFMARMTAARRMCLFERDVLQRAEQELERRMHAVALERMSALAGALAHDLRTPLGVARLACDRLRIREDRVAPEARPILDRLEQGVNGMAETLDDLLDVFGVSEHVPRWERFSPAQVLHEAAASVRENLHAGTVLLVECDPAAASASGLGDPDGVRKLVRNLVRNAARHAGEGNVRVQLDAAPGGVRLTVVDHGEGIPESLLPWLGEPLLLSSESAAEGRFARGNGMGLAVCRRIVARHGGAFTVRSQVGAGTRIEALLRLDLPSAAPTGGPDQFSTQVGPP